MLYLSFESWVVLLVIVNDGNLWVEDVGLALFWLVCATGSNAMFESGSFLIGLSKRLSLHHEALVGRKNDKSTSFNSESGVLSSEHLK